MQLKTRTSFWTICSLSLLGFLLSPQMTHAQKLTPTFESIGISWDRNDIVRPAPLGSSESKGSQCTVEYRKSGETEWRKGLDLFVNPGKNDDNYQSNYPNCDKGEDAEKVKGLRGSIVMLEPATTYQVKLTYSINGNVKEIKELTATTWSNDFKVAKTIPISNRSELKDAIADNNGSEAGYVVLDGQGATIKGSESSDNIIDVTNKRYIILRDMKFTVSKKHGVNIRNSNHIVVEKCDIYEWGEKDAKFCGGEALGYRDGGKQAGIFIQDSEHVVVQRNKIHDPRTQSCHWGTFDGITLKEDENSHPNGPRGIAVDGVSESVFRYNRVYASEGENQYERYFADIFNGEQDGTEGDIDIYGNEFSHCWDDGIEIEGNNNNIRVWGNVIRNVFQGVASDRVGATKRSKGDKCKKIKLYYGPVYIWRNVITDLQRDPNDGKGGNGAFKLENSHGQGGIYLFNNTVSGLTNLEAPQEGFSQRQHYLIAKNNIFEVNTDGEGKIYNEKMEPTCFLDYNAYSRSRNGSVRQGWEENGKFNVSFSYTHAGGWNYYVANEEARGTGTPIPNFADFPEGTIDLGAAQEGVWSMCVGPDANCDNAPGNPPTPPTPPVDTLPEPDFTPIRAAYAPFFNQFGHSFSSSPKTYWATAPSYTFTHPDGTGPEGSDNQVTLRAVWDLTHLTVAVEVIDDDTVAVDADDPFKNDGIELFFDVRNNNAAQWEGRPDEHKQFIIDFNRNTQADPSTFEARAERANITPRAPHARYEVRIPWASLGIEQPEAGLSVGFDVVNNDRQEDGKTHFSYTQRTGAFRVPGEFARLELIDTPPVPVAAAAGPLVVDGRLDELDWDYVNAENGVSSYQFVLRNDVGSATSVSSKMLWTPEYLYVGVKALGDEVMIEDPNKPWSNDGMEILFDPRNNKAPDWSIDLGHKQLVVDADGNRYQDPGADQAGSLTPTVAQRRDSSGYTIEIAIPWSNLTATPPQVGDRMSFDLVHNDRDPNGYQAVTLSGRRSGVKFKTPSAFVDFELVETFNVQTLAVVVPEVSEAPGLPEADPLMVFPNPVTDVLHVRIGSASSPETPKLSGLRVRGGRTAADSVTTDRLRARGSRTSADSVTKDGLHARGGRTAVDSVTTDGVRAMGSRTATDSATTDRLRARGSRTAGDSVTTDGVRLKGGRTAATIAKVGSESAQPEQKGADVRVLSLTGQTMLRQRLDRSGTVDVSHLPAGTYVVNIVQDGNVRWQTKVIKQ